MMLRSVIIDDERLSRELLHSLINEYCPEVHVIGEADCVTEAKQLIVNQHPELVFLDIEMPGKNGFELLRDIGQAAFKTVFVTAYSQYAIQAIRQGGFDYLLKPIDVDELKLSISRAKTNNPISIPVYGMPSAEELDGKLAVHHARGFKLVSFRDIVRLEADNNYTFIYLAGEPRILVSKPITEVGSRLLESAWFFRAHRSHIINFYHFKEYLREDGGYILMSDGKSVSLSRLRQEEFLSKVNTFAHYV